MRAVALLAVLAGLIAAQPRNASPLIRGVLVEREKLPAGEFSVRASNDQVFRYRFDPKTYVEREERLIDVPRLDPGEKVEVLSDEGPGSAVRYARTIHVILPAPPPRPLSQGRLRADRTPVDHFAPLSNLSFSGVVSRLAPDRMVLHTRQAGDRTILLRRDTRYLQNGEVVDPAVLEPNMRVFIRAGRNLYNEIEAYQVIWGEILEPQ